MKSYVLIILALIISISGKCYAVDWSVVPNDLPTIETLISLHKCLKKDEDKALERITTSHAEHVNINDVTKKFNDVRTTLDTKMNNVYSYIILATAIAGTATDLYEMIKEYKDFTVNTFKYVQKKPFIAWYYTNANLSIAREVKHCKDIYLAMAESGMNLLRSTMKEKFQLIYTLKAEIVKIRYIIYKANSYCELMILGGWKPMYIWEILNSDVVDQIARGVINRWDKVNK